MLLTSGTIADASTNSNPNNPAQLLSQLTSGQLLALKPNHRGGIILQKPFYADFVGAGGAIGYSFDSHCTAVYFIGDVELYTPVLLQERHHALQQRMAYSHRLANIAALPVAIERTYQIIDQLCEWVGPERAKAIPDVFMAQLVGASPKYVKVAWKKHGQNCHVFAHIPRNC